MKKLFIAALLTVLCSGAAFAKSVSATGSTLDDAQHSIAQQAKRLGFKSYHITSASWNNHAYMTATLSDKQSDK